MRAVSINKCNLLKLLNSLRNEDYLELCQTFGKNFKKRFIEITLKANEKYFFADDFDSPLAIGGVEDSFKDNLKIGQIWLISSKNFKKSNIKLIKFIKNKIEDFKKNHDILFNVIYKSNYDALKWLTKCGFKVLDLNNKNYKLFYFTKGGINFDLRYITR